MTPQDAIHALIDAGWSEARIAREVNVSQPTVHRIKHDQNARGADWQTGQALILLAEKSKAQAAGGAGGPIGGEAA